MKSIKHMKLPIMLAVLSMAFVANAQKSGLPDSTELNRPFGKADIESFAGPAKVYYPETWFHYISGNVSEKGITADLEAIAGAGFSGIQMFHGHFSDNVWPGVDRPIACLSPLWNDALRHTGEECGRLGLRFTMQNCPGWAMSGGPWIEPKDAMRHLVYSRTDISNGNGEVMLPVPQPSGEDWRDYRDIAVLAFPTPLGDTGAPLIPASVTSDLSSLPWMGWLSATDGSGVNIPPSAAGSPHWVEVTFPEKEVVRTLELPCVQGFNHAWCFEPGVAVAFKAEVDGEWKELFATDLPQSSWQDDRPMTLACPEVPGGARKYRLEISNLHDINFNMLRMYSAARKNNWEAEAGWTLRAIERNCDAPDQSPEAYVRYDDIMDISKYMSPDGKLKWDAPDGKWTVLRIGHVNTGQRNGPAPVEGTGWECNKLSRRGSDVHFANYIGRLSGSGGPVDGLLGGMLMDSWECRTQTWTDSMESDFNRISGYELRRWIPALFGYVINDNETTTCMLHDWKRTINVLLVDNFYGNMARHARERGLTVSYETAGGDVVPVDIMEYFKHADIPMCEFWQPLQENYVGSINFKPIKPTASAARMYGKPRVAAEAFTSFSHTWDEHLWQLKEVANVNIIEGVTHLVFHTYTHNPQTGFLAPGTSFGGQGIGTPFLRGQTWWKHMPDFTDYLARCTYMLERGKPVSDVLWYLGDEIDHKPDQKAPFPAGYKYDYCNTDALLNRISVKDGQLVTPEGISYRVLWIPDSRRLLPVTLEKIHSLVRDGATVVSQAPVSVATLAADKKARKRFASLVSSMWGKGDAPAVRKVGKGRVMSGYGIGEALAALAVAPDVTGGDALWLHRRADNADWYFVCAPKDNGFSGKLSFRSSGNAAIFDPVTGSIAGADVVSQSDGRTTIDFDLARAGSCFVVFSDEVLADKPEYSGAKSVLTLDKPWTISFPEGWGAPEKMTLDELKAWKDLNMSDEGKAFSGTAVYNTTFDLTDKDPAAKYTLDLGDVDMVAVVKVNGKTVRTLWAPPFSADISEYVRKGVNDLTVEVTGTWFNRLAYDASRPENERKTWAVRRPDPNSPLRPTGLFGPVTLATSNR